MGERLLRIKATPVARWKAPAFLENLAIDADGAVFVTVYSHNRVDRYNPATGATATSSWRVRRRRWDLRLMPAACFG